MTASADALRAPAIALAAGILFGPIVAAVRSPPSLLRTEHVLMFGLIYWILLDAIQGAYFFSHISHAGMVGAFMGTALFAATIWIGNMAGAAVYPRGMPVWKSDLSVDFLFVAALLCSALGMLRVVWGCSFSLGCVIDSFFQSRLQARWLQTDLFGALDSLLLNLRFFGYLVLPIAAAILQTERRPSWRFWVSAVLGLMFLVLLVRDGARREVGAVVGATAFVWVLLRARVRARHMLALLGAAAGLLLVLQAMVAWRDVGFGTGFSEGRSLDVMGRSGLVVDKNLQSLARVITLVPDRHPHTGATGMLYVVSAPIPRSVFPMKPRNPATTLLPAMGMAPRPGWSLTLSAVGDLYFIGGFVMIAAGGFLYGVMAHLITSLLFAELTIRSRLIYGVATLVLFVALRSVSEISGSGLALLALWGLFAMRRALFKRRLMPDRAPAS